MRHGWRGRSGRRLLLMAAILGIGGVCVGVLGGNLLLLPAGDDSDPPSALQVAVPPVAPPLAVVTPPVPAPRRPSGPSLTARSSCARWLRADPLVRLRFLAWAGWRGRLARAGDRAYVSACRALSRRERGRARPADPRFARDAVRYALRRGFLTPLQSCRLPRQLRTRRDCRRLLAAARRRRERERKRRSRNRGRDGEVRGERIEIPFDVRRYPAPGVTDRTAPSPAPAPAPTAAPAPAPAPQPEPSPPQREPSPSPSPSPSPEPEPEPSPTPERDPEPSETPEREEPEEPEPGERPGPD